MLVGTKNDMWRDRQIQYECGVEMTQTYGCARFLEISTKEDIDEVGNKQIRALF